MHLFSACPINRLTLHRHSRIMDERLEIQMKPNISELTYLVFLCMSTAFKQSNRQCVYTEFIPTSLTLIT